jgi:hypothetical protein
VAELPCESVVASDQIVTAVADLDPRSRALLELAARRGMGDADMAALLRVRPADIQHLREQATHELAVVLKLDPGEYEGLQQELARLDEADWERRALLLAGEPGSRGRSRLVAAGAVLLAVAGIAGVFATRGNHERYVATAVAAPITPESGPAVTFQRLNGSHGRGSVRLIWGPSGARVRLRVGGLLRPQGGGYTVWLYNSPADAHRLAFTTFADFHGWLRLPRDHARYRFVDISREVTDDSAHSDLSLLRAPQSALRRVRN